MTENNISSASDTITMYCTQPDLVWDIVDKDGVNYVKQAYITKKYQNTAWIFDTAYKFFRQEAVKIIPKPQEAESPIWMYRDKKMGSSECWLPAYAPGNFQRRVDSF